MEKLNILFDASHLGAVQLFGGSWRSGIYLYAVNILRALFDSGDAVITLYCRPEFFYPCIELCNKELQTYRFAVISENETVPVSQYFYRLYAGCIQKKQRAAAYIPRKAFACFAWLLKSLGYITCRKSNQFRQKIKSFGIYYSPSMAPPESVLSCVSIKRFVLLHDVIPLVFNGKHRKTWFFELVDSINADDYYFANSRFTKSDFQKHVPKISPEKISIAYSAPSDSLHIVTNKTELSAIKHKYGIDEQKHYFLSVCNLTARKNLLNMCRAFLKFVNETHITDTVFVLAGPEDGLNVMKSLGQLTDEDTGNINCIGYVDDTDLPALYSGALCFVYTSRYEGFGLPVLEAMKCGCPVITSKSTSLPEVAGEAAIMVDYDSIEQHIDAYKAYYFNETLREQNKRLGLNRAELFSWEKTADSMFSVFRNVLKFE